MSMWQWDVHSVFAMLRPRPGQLITDNSILLRHGALTFFSHNTMTSKMRYFFLFDHAFLVTKQSKRNKFQLKIYITLRPGLRVITDERDNQFRLNATLKGRNYPIIMYAQSRKEKEAWVRDIETAIGRLSDKSYGLESNALSTSNPTGIIPEEPQKPAREKEKGEKHRRPLDDTPQSYLRRDAEEDYYHSRSGHSDLALAASYDDEPSHRSSKRESPSHRRRSVSSKASSSSPREKEPTRERHSPREDKSKRSRKVWYDSDEAPHFYTDSEDEYEDSEGDDSGSSGSNSSHESERRHSVNPEQRKPSREPQKSRDDAHLSRRVSEPDALAHRRKSLNPRPKVHSASDAREGLQPPPKASSSKVGKKRTSASTPNLPALEKDDKGISNAFDLLSLNSVPPSSVSSPPSYPSGGQPQPFYSSQFQAAPAQQRPQPTQPNGSSRGVSLGVKVMDVGNLNSDDFNRIASRGFTADKQQTPSAPAPLKNPTPTTLPSTSQPQPTSFLGTPQFSSVPSATPTTSLEPQMYQQMLLQQQQQYLQLLQKSGQPSTTPLSSLGQPSATLSTSSTSFLGQPSLSASAPQPLQMSTPSLLGQPSLSSSQPLSTSVPQQQLLQQIQMQQAQLQALQQQYARLSASGGVPTTATATPPLAYSSGASQPVMFSSPLAYQQYQQLEQQQQYLQQQQLLLQQQMQQNKFSYPPSSSTLQK